MKKNVEIVGISHKCGTSKAGKAFDFHVLHCVNTDEQKDTSGRCVFSAIISEEMVLGLAAGQIGFVYSHFYNGREIIDYIYTEK